jgi:hypothetical protein
MTSEPSDPSQAAMIRSGEYTFTHLISVVDRETDDWHFMRLWTRESMDPYHHP